jgi:hypothetical protein
MRASLVLVLVLALAGEAGAASNLPGTPAPGRERAARLSVGLGTPIGFGGVELEFAPRRSFGLAAGIGRGFAGPNGAVSARGRWWLGDSFSLGAGVGLSAGSYRWEEGQIRPVDCGDLCAAKEGVPVWFNLEVAAELRVVTALSIRLFAGVGFMTTPGAMTCVSARDHCEDLHQNDGEGPLPYVGLAMGRVF